MRTSMYYRIAGYAATVSGYISMLFAFGVPPPWILLPATLTAGFAIVGGYTLAKADIAKNDEKTLEDKLKEN